MKTTIQKSGNVKLGVLNTFMLTASVSNAETTNKFTKVLNESFSGDGFIGVYVIGAVLAFGIIGFIIVSKIGKKEKIEENFKENLRSMPQRNHHNHRIIKKSA